MARKPNLRRKPHILFVGHTNAARTQMAEAYARELMADLVTVRSAGVEDTGIDARAIQVMRDEGIAIDSQVSKPLDQGLLDWADLVITLSGDALKVHLPPSETFVHKNWPIDDPAPRATDDTDARPYQAARDEIKRRVKQLAMSMRLMQV